MVLIPFRPLFGRTGTRLRALALLSLLLVLAACGAQRVRQPAAEWQAPALKQHVGALLRQLPTPCRHFALRLVALDRPVAEIDFARRIALSRGMLRLLQDESELLFVLAHEVAHYELSHRAPRDPAKRLPLELEADAQAVQVLCELGLDSGSARHLLQRLNQPDREIADPDLQALALSEVATRLQHLGDCRTPGRDGLLLSAEEFRHLVEAADTTVKPAPTPPRPSQN